MLPLCIMADRNDFGGISTPLHPQTALASVFIYDALPGGAGLARAAFAQAETVLATTLAAVADCPCEAGCPSCVHSPKCGSGNRPISKEGAVLLLRELLRAPATPPEYPDISIDAARVADPLLAAARPAPPTQPRGRIATGLDNTGLDAKVILDAAYTPLPPPARYMVLDVETRLSAAEVGGWNHAGRMGVSVAVLYDSAGEGGAGSFSVYTQDAIPALTERLRAADAVVGFNSWRFDYAVLQPFAAYRLKDLPSIDLLQRIQDTLSYRVRLDNVAQATLGEPKSADGLQALQWWKEGNMEAIAAYCRKDVDITRRVYLYGLERGYVLFSNKAGQRARARVDFGLRG